MFCKFLTPLELNSFYEKIAGADFLGYPAFGRFVLLLFRARLLTDRDVHPCAMVIKHLKSFCVCKNVSLSL